mmetsp:Transcript_15885/g.27687  ORF Transcript_15885/g.27687 Transcript_15885/m.27687 type:complete len:277 (+) Transcript_15885:1159-1989(+)
MASSSCFLAKASSSASCCVGASSSACTLTSATSFPAFFFFLVAFASAFPSAFFLAAASSSPFFFAVTLDSPVFFLAAAFASVFFLAASSAAVFSVTGASSSSFLLASATPFSLSSCKRGFFFTLGDTKVCPAGLKASLFFFFGDTANECAIGLNVTSSSSSSLGFTVTALRCKNINACDMSLFDGLASLTLSLSSLPFFFFSRLLLLPDLERDFVFLPLSNSFASVARPAFFADFFSPFPRRFSGFVPESVSAVTTASFSSTTRLSELDLGFVTRT